MAKETMIIELPCNQAVELYRICTENRITLDELVEKFMCWCIREPEACKQWFEENKYLLEEKPLQRMVHHSLNMPEISEEELVAHIDDDDFLLVYGNPILIRSKNNQHDCVIMSIQYYERTQRLLGRLEDQIASMCSNHAQQHPNAEDKVEDHG